MKTIERILRNPSPLLRDLAAIIREEFVLTCRSATCAHASHEAGYVEVECTLPEWVKVERHNGSPHSRASHEVDLDASFVAGIEAGAAGTREFIAIANTREFIAIARACDAAREARRVR